MDLLRWSGKSSAFAVVQKCLIEKGAISVVRLYPLTIMVFNIKRLLTVALRVYGKYVLPSVNASHLPMRRVSA
ncbi:hypothetical protein [Paenibacillus phytorum]|uniref:hypothetical protein n=1 Tax=Paenibacillus phytorum TaxID=2654977 RepID=UPI001492585D|nr:hypothetical protein [Paenibacillus phytorum]